MHAGKLTKDYAALIKDAFHPRYWDETLLTAPQHLEFDDPLNPEPRPENGRTALPTPLTPTSSP